MSNLDLVNLKLWFKIKTLTQHCHIPPQSIECTCPKLKFYTKNSNFRENLTHNVKNQTFLNKKLK